MPAFAPNGHDPTDIAQNKKALILLLTLWAQEGTGTWRLPYLLMKENVHPMFINSALRAVDPGWPGE